MITGTYPPHKAKEMLKLTTDPKKPPYAAGTKKVHNWVAQCTTGLYKIYAVYQCPDEKLGEALLGLTKHYNFYSQCEGYHFCIEVIGEADEVVKYMMA